ncbi:MAG: PepSY-associated TM helix domain-containing protein, partial [Cellvibrio sp.]
MTIRKWHWMSSALCFICMLLFSVTGITLNHAADIEASPKTSHLEGVVPEKILTELVLNKEQKTVEVPAAILQWFKDTHKLKFSRTQA